MKNDYAYAVARIRANENKLLKEEDFKSLLDASLQEEKEILSLHGWDSDEEDINKLLKNENEKLFKLLSESLLNKDELRIFTVKNDFFNIKAALKCNKCETSASTYFLTPTSLNVEKLQTAFQNREFSFLSGELSDETKKAFKILCETSNLQNSEIVLDKAALCLLKDLSQKSKCDLLKKVYDIVCCVTNIKIAFRCSKENKSESFCKNALCHCSAFDIDELSKKCVKGEKELLKFFENSEFAKAAKLCLKGTAQFEGYLDNEIQKLCQSSKFIFVGFEPIAAFYFSKQAEFRKVRLILTLKRAGFSKEDIEEKMNLTV